MKKPISPKDVTNAKTQELPDFVIDAFNRLIAQKWDGRQSIVKHDDVVTLIKQLGGATELPFAERQVIPAEWLDIEPIYEAEGWDVKYDKPGYNETYGAFYVFKEKRD